MPFIILSGVLFNWTRKYLQTSVLFRDIKYIEELQKYVIISWEKVYITEDLETVTSVLTYSTSSLYNAEIGYSKTLQKVFVIGYYQNQIGYMYTSANLSDWSLQQFDGKKLNSISCNDNVIIITLNDTNKILKGTDGLNWEEVAISEDSSVRLGTIDCDGNNFCIGAYRGNDCCVLYGNGESFNLYEIQIKKSNEAFVQTGVQYCKGLGGFIITDVSYRTLFNGTSFIYIYKNEAGALCTYSEERGLYYALGNWGITISEDSVHWHDTNNGISRQSSRIFYIKEKDELIILTGGVIKRAKNGIDDWEEKAYLEGQALRNIIYDSRNELYVVIGRNGFIATSPDLENWTTQTSGTTEELYDIAVIGNKCLCLGEYILLESTDLETWTTVFTTYDDPKPMYNISYSEEKNICLISSHEGVYYSYDITNWQFKEIADERLLMFYQIKYHKKYKVFYALIRYYFTDEREGGLWKSSNGLDWEETDSVLPRTASSGNLIFNYKLNISTIFGSDTVVTTEGESQNIIDKLSQDSDLKFNLEIGSNIILSNVNCILQYRQKYIGV